MFFKSLKKFKNFVLETLQDPTNKFFSFLLEVFEEVFEEEIEEEFKTNWVEIDGEMIKYDN